MSDEAQGEAAGGAAGAGGSAPLIVNKRELADHLGITLPTVDAWHREGMPCLSDGTNGRPYEFDAHACTEWARARREAEDARKRELDQLAMDLRGGREAEGPEKGLDPDKRKKLIETAFLADKLDVARKRLYPREEVEADLSAVFSLLRQMLLSDAAALQRLLGLTEEQTRKLDADRRDKLNQLANQIATLELRAVVLDLLNAAA